MFSLVGIAADRARDLVLEAILVETARLKCIAV